MLEERRIPWFVGQCSGDLLCGIRDETDRIGGRPGESRNRLPNKSFENWAVGVTFWVDGRLEQHVLHF